MGRKKCHACGRLSDDTKKILKVGYNRRSEYLCCTTCMSGVQDAVKKSIMSGRGLSVKFDHI